MKTVVFRPTNNCNLRCTYCYDKNNHMTDEKEIRKNSTELFLSEKEQLLKSLSLLYQNERKPHLLFHGGEPLLIESTVLDEFCGELREKCDITFSIQTNGTLITDSVISLFKKYGFKVGLSLDGCNENLNHARVYPNGLNSFSTVIKNIRKLHSDDIAFGVIMSVTKNHLGCEQELYDFIANETISCNIRPVFATEPDDLSQIMLPEEYAEFFDNLFDIWFFDDSKKVSTHQIYELYQALKKVLFPSYVERSCNNSNQCFKDFISMDVFSNLYACNRLYGIDKFYYGNLKTNTIESIYEKIDLLLEERNLAISQNDDCKNCESIKECYGGCPAEAYDMYGSITMPSVNCKVKRLIANHVKECLK